MKRRVLATLAAAALVLGPLAVSANPVSAHESTGTRDETVPVESHAYGLARAKRVVEKRLVGRSVQGRRIVAYRKGNPAASRTVLVLGQMHGNEAAGPVTARYIVERLPVDSDVDLWVIPSMNPDGAARRTRRNARGVDLNRNWPTSGWTRGSRSSVSYGGPRPASEPETRAMLAFLKQVQPELITSIHQPFGSVARNDKTPRYVDRLSRYLGLPKGSISLGTAPHQVAPTLTSWYNANFAGGAVTVEYTRSPSDWFKTVKAGNGILRANLADW
jgi:murein tripeptide amidase MpaA